MLLVLACATSFVAQRSLLPPSTGPSIVRTRSMAMADQAAQEAGKGGYTIDNRRGAGAAPRPDDSSKYGGDPREVPSTGGEECEADTAWASTIAASAVNQLQTVGQLQAALDLAKDEAKVVCLKFMRDGCAACASTEKEYAGLAADLDDVLLFEVDFDLAKPFCRRTKIRFVPSVHIYTANEFRVALPIGKKAWGGFSEQLEEYRASLAS